MYTSSLPPATEKQKAPRFTSYVVVFTLEKCDRWGKTKKPQQGTHKQQRHTQYNQFFKGLEVIYMGLLIFFIHPLTHFEYEEEDEQYFLRFSPSIKSVKLF